MFENIEQEVDKILATKNYAKAIYLVKEHIFECEEKFGLNSVDTAAGYSAMSTIYYAQEKYEDALVYSKKALASFESVPTASKADIATMYNNVGALYATLQEYPKAFQFLEKSIAIREQVMGDEILDLINLFREFMDMDFDDEKHKRRVENKRMNMGISCHNLGALYLKEKRYKKALTYFMKAVNMFEQTEKRDTERLISVYKEIADTYLQMDKMKTGLRYHRKIVELAEAEYGTNDIRLVEPYANISWYLTEMNGNKLALAYRQKSLAIQEAHYGVDCIEACETRFDMAFSYLGLKRYSKMCETWIQALHILKTNLPDSLEELKFRVWLVFTFFNQEKKHQNPKTSEKYSKELNQYIEFYDKNRYK